ncbi:MAG: hypothetical protein AVDCRST_MAG74-2213 [uncultured Pyrinomonadaceae bacterium]|uniref:Uncharacterized protein n=1 Tax=uncultured Pyrinomonadaceae bacterium TaxID=2283094 RepID=A0A6J4P9E7_9BACT|nr:MAG: hypothetical protein AVDCRST_MAG74-2213 [uncultured Pyrinomonadaceae bacterium]
MKFNFRRKADASRITGKLTNRYFQLARRAAAEAAIFYCFILNSDFCSEPIGALSFLTL